MEDHPEYSIHVLQEAYSGAFQKPTRVDTCSQLRTDKWNTCHPEGGSILECNQTMSKKELHALYQSHKKCHEFRVVEN